MVKYQGKEIVALIDTGATHSFLRKDLVGAESLGEQHYVRLAEDREVTATGPISVNMELGGELTTIMLYILSDMREDLILGVDWLRREGAVIDLNWEGMYVGKVKRRAVYWENAKQKLEQMGPVQLGETNVESAWLPHYEIIVNEFPEVFFEGMMQPRTNLVEHEIVVKQDRPFKIRRYHFSAKKKNR